MDGMSQKTTHREFCATSAPKGPETSLAGLPPEKPQIQRWLFVGNCDYSTLAQVCQVYGARKNIFLGENTPFDPGVR